MSAQLSQMQARRMLLAAQGLWPRPRRRADKESVLAAIRRMGALQIDTIQVVARSPYFVLWSRLGDYEPRWLDELLTEGKVFEYWAHAACFLPAEDYPLYRRTMLHRTNRPPRKLQWLEANRPLADAILQRIREHGPVLSRDFVRSDGAKKGGWWSWTQEKMALEVLFDLGELMISRRLNFQRVYDLRERVRPDWDDARLPSVEEANRQLILRSVRSLGIVRPQWVRSYFTPKAATMTLLAAMAKAGELSTFEVAGWDGPGLVHPDNLPLLDGLHRRSARQPATTLLSPFDPVVWDRARALELFGFNYRLECYTPGPRRKFGYFSLPILHRDSLVGRLDAKAHRKEGIFEVKALHLEPPVTITGNLVDGLRDALARCADWHRCPEVVIRQSEPSVLAGLVSRE